ncbi:MAG: methyltransferase domain-containing protein [Aeromicrobium sp.]|nr:methyltransferase domain-containing protein [Aeromicrobium sp.]
MGFFDWAAPLIRRYGDRFGAEDAVTIAGWLRAAVEPGGHVLDVGGGAGQLAALLADTLTAHVTVLDPTAAMLSHVPTRPRITAVSGSAEDIPLPDSAFDAIVVTDAFHHFRDQDAAVREFARVVRPGGAVLVLDLDPRPLAMRVIALAERLVGEPAAFMTPEQMCTFMASRGIPGECTPEAGASYRFLGRVEKDLTAA